MFVILLLLISVFVVFVTAGFIISDPDSDQSSVFFAIVLLIFGIGLLAGLIDRVCQVINQFGQ